MSRLQELQATIEAQFSRHNIRNAIHKDLEKSDLISLTTATKTAIKNYIHGRYYKSKDIRIRHLKDNLIMKDLVTDIMVIVMAEEGIQPIQSAASRLANTLDFENVFDGIKTASELLAVVCKTDMFDIIAANQSETGSLMIKSNYRLNDSTLQYIANTKYLPPLVCVPHAITSNSDNGYITKNESVILGKDNHHEEYQALDVLNTSQNIALSLDKETLEYEEVSKKPLDTPEKISNFLRIVVSSKQVYQDLLTHGNKFFFTWKYDKRGRVYSQGYHVNIQSTSFKKALINLNQKHLITGA